MIMGIDHGYGQFAALAGRNKARTEASEGWTAMITKETFCAALGQILEQREIDAKVGAALESVGDGHFVFGCKNRYLTALLLVLKEAVNDQYDYIDWWLYDASPDYKVWTEDGTKEWCLKEPGALYDFIVAGT